MAIQRFAKRLHLSLNVTMLNKHYFRNTVPLNVTNVLVSFHLKFVIENIKSVMNESLTCSCPFSLSLSVSHSPPPLSFFLCLNVCLPTAGQDHQLVWAPTEERSASAPEPLLPPALPPLCWLLAGRGAGEEEGAALPQADRRLPALVPGGLHDLDLGRSHSLLALRCVRRCHTVTSSTSAFTAPTLC